MRGMNDIDFIDKPEDINACLNCTRGGCINCLEHRPKEKRLTEKQMNRKIAQIRMWCCAGYTDNQIASKVHLTSVEVCRIRKEQGIGKV